MRRRTRIPIDELLDYWIDISKRPILTLEDYALFFERAKATVTYFSEFYPRMSDKFFDRIHYMVVMQARWLEVATEGKRYLGFMVGSAAMIAAAVIELIWGIAAERRPLEDVARPLTFAK